MWIFLSQESDDDSLDCWKVRLPLMFIGYGVLNHGFYFFTIFCYIELNYSRLYAIVTMMEFLILLNFYVQIMVIKLVRDIL